MSTLPGKSTYLARSIPTVDGTTSDLLKFLLTLRINIKKKDKLWGWNSHSMVNEYYFMEFFFF